MSVFGGVHSIAEMLLCQSLFFFLALVSCIDAIVCQVCFKFLLMILIPVLFSDYKDPVRSLNLNHFTRSTELGSVVELGFKMQAFLTRSFALCRPFLQWSLPQKRHPVLLPL